MQITQIDDLETNDKQVAYVTDPPLTQAVFAGYSEMVGPGNMFKFHKSGLLITTRHDLDAAYLKATAEHLTQIERQIQSGRDQRVKARKELLDRVSKQSGLPIRKQSPVADSAGGSSDADKK